MIILAKIADTVRQRAQNTFLWVALAFKELDVEDSDSNPLHGKYALRRIKTIPPGLSELYRYIMAKIETGLEDDPQYCKTVLATAVLAYRPLTVLELAIVADIPPEIDSKTIVRKCGSFLTCNGETVYLIHQSAKDFLLQELSATIFPSGIEDVHHSIFLRSLQIVNRTLSRDIYKLKAPGTLFTESSHQIQTLWLLLHTPASTGLTTYTTIVAARPPKRATEY